VTETEIWVVIGLCAAVTAAIKGAGPVALGGRDLPAAFNGVIRLMAPALLAALVCVSVLADGEDWAVGPDTAGVAAAGLLLWRGANIMIAVAVAVVVTAGWRGL
jgi:branched-subunit amino acid transport protein